jgi:hypothetical protein
MPPPPLYVTLALALTVSGSMQVRPEQRGAQAFDVVTPGRVYHFTLIDTNVGPGVWVEKIMEVVQGRLPRPPGSPKRPSSPRGV